MSGVLIFAFPQKLREEILVMKMYFLSCRKAMEDKLLLQVWTSTVQHLQYQEKPSIEFAGLLGMPSCSLGEGAQELGQILSKLRKPCLGPTVHMFLFALC